MTDKRPRFGRGEESRHGEEKASSVQQRGEGRDSEAANKVPVSELCNELGIQPSLFYHWQRQALENLAVALSGPTTDGPSKREKELVAENRRLGAAHVILDVSAYFR